MPRLRLRLSTLVLLIVIIALGITLFVQRRRETALDSRVRILEDENEWSRLSSRRLNAVRERQLNELRAQIARPTGNDQDTGRDRSVDQGDGVRPNH